MKDALTRVMDSLSGSNREIKVCINCKTKYTRGLFDFYSLCTECFTKFNDQKMTGRWAMICNKPHKYYENPTDWIQSLQGDSNE